MKLSTLILAASLALNIALAAMFVAGTMAPRSAPPPSVTALRAAPAKPAKAGSDQAWSLLHSDDLRTECDRLIAEGFPPNRIRAILTAQIREAFAARRKALDAAAAAAPFWKKPRPDPATQAALRALAHEEQKAVKDLLGADPESGTLAALHRQLPNLSSDRIEALAAIQERYNEQRNDIYLAGPVLASNREAIAALEKSQHAEIAATLTPEELEDYDLRTSHTATMLRNTLSAFDPSEAEFRAVYKLQSAFDDQFGLMYTQPAPDQMRLRSDAQKQLNDDIATALGPDRYADYQRATDYNYRQTTQLVARLELPADAANQVYSIQKDIQQQATAIRQSATSPDDRSAQLAQLATLATNAQTRITAVLGPTGYEAYKQFGGQWMQSFAPRPPVAGKK